MSFPALLFSPMGRIGPPPFWRAYIIIIGASLILNVANFIAGPENLIVGLLSTIGGTVLLWCTFAVFAKRLHDAGASGGWTLLIAFGWLIVVGIAVAIILTMFAGDLFTLIQDDPSYASSPEFMIELNERIFVPSTIASLVIALGLGFILASLASDPGPNQHGPAPGGDADAFN